MGDEFVNRPLREVVEHVCSTMQGETFLVNPSRRLLGAVVQRGVDHPGDFPEVRLIAEEETLKVAMDDFTIASRAADLVESDRLVVRYLTNPPKSSLAVDRRRMLAIIDAGEGYGAVGTADDTFVDELFAACGRRFVEAEEYILHTPPISRIEATLADRMGERHRADFMALVDEAGTFDVPVDEVVLSLLVASMNEDLLYDISKWGEDIGLASKATFSRKKSDLEECGLITTEPEPIDVGRPRLRLKLADPNLNPEPSADVLRTTIDRLAT